VHGRSSIIAVHIALSVRKKVLVAETFACCDNSRDALTICA
jgi:hypothetical protein